jgi:hypothetical protein
MAKKSDLLIQVILPIIVLVHTILFIIYWQTNSLF